jgi:hypothetical protein
VTEVGVIEQEGILAQVSHRHLQRAEFIFKVVSVLKNKTAWKHTNSREKIWEIARVKLG